MKGITTMTGDLGKGVLLFYLQNHATCWNSQVPSGVIKCDLNGGSERSLPETSMLSEQRNEASLKVETRASRNTAAS